MPTTAYDGLRVGYRWSDGPGRPLVYVHGYCCSSADWAAQLAHVAGRHPVLAPDLPGHGDSEARPDAWTIEAGAGAVGAAMTAAGVRDAILVGHSMGCRVVLQAVLDRPGRVAGVVLVDGSRVGSGDRAAATAAAAARIAAVGGREWIERSFRAMFLPGADEALRARLTGRAVRTPPEAATRLLPSMFGWDTGMEAALRALDVPVLALQSTDLDDTLQRVAVRPGEPTPWLRTLTACARDVRVEVVPARSHFPMVENPGAVDAAIDRFAAELDRSRPY